MEDSPSDQHGRVQALSRVVLRILSTAYLGLLSAGSLVAIWTKKFTDVSGGEVFSLVRIPGYAFADTDGLSVLLGIGFVGLLVCTVAAVVITLIQWMGGLNRVVRRVGRVLAVLMLIGASVPVVFTLQAAVSDHFMDPGLGMAFYVPGAVLFAVLMFSGDIDRLRE